MTDGATLRTRAATIADAAPIAEIYNQGIVDRVATFETESRAAAQIEEWLTGRNLVMVAKTAEMGVVAFAASFPYSRRPCYHRRIFGLCEAGLSRPRRRSRGARRIN